MRTWTPRLLLLASFSLAVAGCAREPVLPRSFQAEVLSIVDPARVQLQATGIGKEFEWAVRDAQKAAMARVMQDIVQSAEEKQRFDGAARAIYRNVERYVERWELRDRRRRPDGDIEVRGSVVVNRRLIEDDLVARGVVLERRQLLSELERPTLAVLPDADTAGADWQRFAANQASSYLTQRRYDVVDLDQLRQIEADTDALRGIDGIPEDPKARIALRSGADIYLEYGVRLDEGQVGRDRTVKASASVKAFETTTARQIGAATGFSKDYAATAGAGDKAIAEAVGDAIDRVLANINDYWKDDLAQGRQYMVTIRGQFGSRDRAARRAVYEALREVAGDLKENVATDQTLNYRVWYRGSNTELLFALQDKVESALGGRELREVTTSRKLLVLAIE